MTGSSEVALVVVAGREICIHPVDGTEDGPGPTQDLQVLLLGASDPQLDLNSDEIALLWTEGVLGWSWSKTLFALDELR